MPLHSERSIPAHYAAAAPLVMLHGWGMNLRVFDAMRRTLAERHPVIALDLPGHGRSRWHDGLGPRLQYQQLRSQIPPGASLLGWSLGGQLALRLARDPALQIRRLVLIATTPRFVRDADWAHGLPLARLREFASRLERDSRGTIADFLELQVRGSAGAAASRAALQQALASHGEAVPAALAAGLRLLEQQDLRALAPKLRQPALVIGGGHDRVTPPQASEALARLLPGAQLLLLERAGHAPFLSHPAEVAAATLAFLRA
jgi:pimeloyl-[acyl-carrier protein] methyl ester esterase